MRVLGVDPGLSGAVGMVTCRPHSIPRLEVFDIPTRRQDDRRYVDARAWRDLLRSLAADLCYFELTWAMPMDPFRAGQKMRGQGTVAAGRTQRSHGVIEAMCWAEIDRDPVYVTPQTWKRFFGLRGGEENKGASRALIADLFPDAAHLFKRVKDDDRAEAALIAVYGAARADVIKIERVG